MAEPQGFVAPTPDELVSEIRTAQYNDSVSSGNQINVRIYAADSIGYEVREEVRNHPLRNNSIQEVSINVSREAPDQAVATISTDNQISGVRTMLAGMANGNLILSTRDGGILRQVDITELAAAEGITAAQIREMQERISYDGEVDRSEQVEIINLIAHAQNIVRVGPTP